MARREKLPPEPPPCPPGAHRLCVVDWIPTRLNEFADRHWSVRKRAKDGDKAVVKVHARIDGIPRATGKRRVHLWIGLTKGQRRPDPDSFFKSLLDALVAAGLLVDDGPKWCELAPVGYGRGERVRTVIDLQEIE